MNRFSEFIRSKIRYLGFDLNHFGRFKILKFLNIDLILDVGANKGQYASSLRWGGYKGNIISYEPLNSAFKILKHKSILDKKWDVFNFGLGDINGVFKINESKNSYSSSILDISTKHLQESPNSKYICNYEVNIKRLDDIFFETAKDFNNIFLKIDTQGFEEKIILGAKQSLKFIKLIQMEVSIEELYTEEKLLLEMCNLMDRIGFKVISIEPGFFSKSNGFMLQAEIIFLNKNS